MANFHIGELALRRIFLSTSLHFGEFSQHHSNGLICLHFQLSAHKDEVASLRITQKELEDALRRARQEADHFKKQLAEAHRVAMSQASTTQALAAAVAPVAAPPQPPPQQQQQPSTFMTDPMNDPYPKWTPSQITVLPSASDSYQGSKPVEL